jgi:hypothetical protein
MRFDYFAEQELPGLGGSAAVYLDDCLWIKVYADNSEKALEEARLITAKIQGIEILRKQRDEAVVQMMEAQILLEKVKNEN